MNDYKKGSNRGKTGRGGDRGFSGRDNRGGGSREMFRAKCDKCHRDAEVPFKPTGDKPIYCRDCFQSNSGRDGGGRNNDRGGFKNNNNQGGRDTFRKGNQGGNTSTKMLEEKINTLSKKLDLVLLALDVDVTKYEKKIESPEKEMITKRKSPEPGELKELIEKTIKSQVVTKKAKKAEPKKPVKKTKNTTTKTSTKKTAAKKPSEKTTKKTTKKK